MSRIRIALDQIIFARKYTLELLDTIPNGRWFEMPGGITHVAWQVGHLTIAQYALVHLRWKGEQPEDEAIFPQQVRKLFSRESTPDPDPAMYPTPDELRHYFNRMHEYTLRVVPTYSDADYELSFTMPHRFCKTRGDCLYWAAAHEMSHAGQIGLVRRLMGEKPMW